MHKLTNEIIASREWRVSELENLKKMGVVALKSEKDITKQQYFKMCVPYIYAHWEGFVVESFKILIPYINELQLEKKCVKQNLYTFSLINVLKPLSGKQRFDQCCEFINKFCNEFNSTFYIDSRLFSTKSNLNYKQLQIILEWFGMENRFINYEYEINKLVNQRNSIAHGENGTMIKYDNISKYVNLLQELYDIFILLFEEYLVNKLYLA